ncbi:polyphenol oxidase family protein [Candidatus Poriferisocius sp.]|uniref:polyphenol oxidase family protein n=1 Tax=Candidatus Poriferisocius sp. TaxID=3101276 RepID=UPI003B52869D
MIGAIKFSFDNDSILAAITSRSGGVSRGEMASLNMAFGVGDDPDCVLANREASGRILGFDHRDLVVAHLEHGSRVKIVEASDRGRGALSAENTIPACDALATNSIDTPVAILVADCAPVVLYDPIKLAVAVAHVGWRGAVARTAQRTIEEMGRAFSSSPSDIRAGIGPCLQPFSLEVSHREAKIVEEAYPKQPAVHYDIGKKPHLDLPFMIKQQLLDAGMELKQIEDMRLDTMDAERFFSHRGQSGRGGRFMAVAMLRATARM